MSDPRLKATKVQIAYVSTDGYRMTWNAKGGTGSKRISTGEPVDPELTLLSALEELARITALFGFEDQALECFNSARKNVAEWRAAQKKSQ